ncbi:MAG: exodeoxyribonuclease VII small subunit [Lachnospiraceae bacterium]|nr:exodeoxyribonuclease VII small subunit [Lachnospiraceae bacterium]
MSKDKLNIEELSLEEGFEKIEEIMNEMSDSDISLEESFEKYKLSMEILKHCSDKIDTVEKQIQILGVEDVLSDE